MCLPLEESLITLGTVIRTGTSVEVFGKSKGDVPDSGMKQTDEAEWGRGVTFAEDILTWVGVCPYRVCGSSGRDMDTAE